MRYTKYYTMKEWKRFDRVVERENGIDITAQEVMCQKYNVILLDHKTKKEKIFGVIDKINIQNLNKGINKFNKGVNQFTKMIESKPSKGSRQFGMSQKEYNELFGPRKSHNLSSKHRVKTNPVSFWGEPEKPKRSKRAKKSEPKHMPFYGSKKVKFF